MGYTIPGWLDEVLDFIGINFPNVDEDDYRDMADAMRDFADQFEGHGAEAHLAFSRLLSSSEGWAVEAMEKHWAKVKASHLEKLPELARLFADACDALAEIIFWMKTKAEAELAMMAGSVGLSIGLAWVTGGLSAVLGAAEITAMRQAVKRILDEAVDRIVDEVIAKVTEPVNAKLEAMVEDMVLDLAEGAFSMPADGASGGGGGGEGGKGRHDGMHLASAGGSGSSGEGKTLRIDHAEFEHGANRVSRRGGDMHTAASSPLGRVKGAFGRSKGRDPFTKVFDSVLHGAIKGSEQALKRVTTHITETVPDRVKATSRLHKHNDLGVRDKVAAIKTGEYGGGDGGHGLPGSGGRPGAGDSLRQSREQLSQRARALVNKFTCGDPIDMATGQMILAQTDADLPGVLPLVLHRAHLSGYTHGIGFGPSWASSLDERLERDPQADGVWWRREDGSSLYYPRTPDIVGDRVEPVAGERLPLTYVSRGTSYALVVQDPYTGLTRHFEPAKARAGVWWLAKLEDRNRNHVSLERGAEDDGPLEVTHSGGYRLTITTAPDSGRVTGLHAVTEDGPLRLRGYRYDESGNLTEVVNAVGALTRLTYDYAHRITGWQDSNGTTFTYVYDESGRRRDPRHRRHPQLPGFHDDFQGALLESDEIMRWELDEEATPLPAELPGSLHGDPSGTLHEFPTANPAAPVLGATLSEAVRDRFAGTGHFIPVNVPGLPAGTYTAYVPTTVADCLDEARSSAPSLTGKIRQAVFRGDRVPVDVPAFRLPENRTYVYWNAWAARLIEEEAPPGSVELRLVWSSDPTATPHRDPMGF